MAQSRRLYCTVARSKTAVAGLLLVLFFCCDARPSSATAACYVDLVLAAGATACVSGTYKYRENPTGSAWITYPTAPLFCQSAGVGGNPAALQGGTVRVTFPRVDGSCSFGGATVVSARNKALAAAVAQASLSTAVPLTAATIANTFSYPAAFDYSVTWTASGLSLDLGAAPSGAPAAPSGLKLNSRAAVAPIAAVAAGRLNVTLSAVVGGRREDEFFSTDLGGLNATLKGCTLGLLTASRAWVFECKRAKVDLPMYTFNPKPVVAPWKFVDVDLLVTLNNLKATAPLASAQPLC